MYGLYAPGTGAGTGTVLGRRGVGCGCGVSEASTLHPPLERSRKTRYTRHERRWDTQTGVGRRRRRPSGRWSRQAPCRALRRRPRRTRPGPLRALLSLRRRAMDVPADLFTRCPSRTQRYSYPSFVASSLAAGTPEPRVTSPRSVPFSLCLAPAHEVRSRLSLP